MARKWNNSLFFSETRGDTVKASIPLSGNWLRNKSHLTNRKTRDLFFFRVTNAPRSMRQPREIIAPFVSFTVVFFNEYTIIKSQKCEFSRIGANKDDTLKYTNIFDPSKHRNFTRATFRYDTKKHHRSNSSSVINFVQILSLLETGNEISRQRRGGKVGAFTSNYNRALLGTRCRRRCAARA